MSDYAKQNGQSPAHPEQLVEDRDGLFVPASRFAECGGMTKREMFAAMAMQGLAANPGGPWQANSRNGWALANCTLQEFAEVCAQAADALLAELAKEAD